MPAEKVKSHIGGHYSAGTTETAERGIGYSVVLEWQRTRQPRESSLAELGKGDGSVVTPEFD